MKKKLFTIILAQSALAAKVELAGTVLAFGAALPLLEQVLTFLTEWTV